MYQFKESRNLTEGTHCDYCTQTQIYCTWTAYCTLFHFNSHILLHTGLISMWCLHSVWLWLNETAIKVSPAWVAVCSLLPQIVQCVFVCRQKVSGVMSFSVHVMGLFFALFTVQVEEDLAQWSSLQTWQSSEEPSPLPGWCFRTTPWRMPFTSPL